MRTSMPFGRALEARLPAIWLMMGMAFLVVSLSATSARTQPTSVPSAEEPVGGSLPPAAPSPSSNTPPVLAQPDAEAGKAKAEPP